MSRRTVLATVASLGLLCATAYLLLAQDERLDAPRAVDAGESVHANNASPQPTTLTWAGCDITKKAFMHELAAAFSKETSIRVELTGGGATKGIRDTAASHVDMGGTCRHTLPVSEENNAKLFPVAWDALVVIVHPTNAVQSISLVELREVLTGKITNWAQLGGADSAVHLAIRHQGPGGKISGVGRMTRELVFHDPDINFSSTAKTFRSSKPLERMVEDNPLGFAVAGVSSAKRRNVKMLRLDDVEPSYDNIARGSYNLVRPLYLVLPKERHSEPARRFVLFALSDKGQAAIRKAGSVTVADGSGLWGAFRQQMLKAGVAMGHY